MSQLVELSSLDLRYEGYRLRDDAREARVMVSVAERGIEHPLEGVDTPAARLLLNGFKRVRSARKLGLDSVPYVSLGEEEAMGILSLMRASTDKALNVLEEGAIAPFQTKPEEIKGIALRNGVEFVRQRK